MSGSLLMAVIVTGDRHARREDWMETLDGVFSHYSLGIDPREYREKLLLHGDCEGIDRLAAEACMNWLAWMPIPCPAPWEAFRQAGRNPHIAGPFRNKQMLTALQAFSAVGYDIAVLAFHNDLSQSKGTAHMVKIARAAGVPVEVYNQQGERLA